MKQQAFCEVCEAMVEMSIKEERFVGVLKGEEYSYIGVGAYCSKCEAKLYVASIHDANMTLLYDAYRKAHHVISLEDILAIPKKYAIGKRPLSLLLGWGELTFSRYCDGDLPTKQYSDILQRIYDDPAYYAEVLEKNKERLPNDHAYQKSRKKVESYFIRQSGASKIEQCVQYLLQECEDITALSLQKALYYIQGFYSAFYKRFLFEEDCQAWVHGPVYKNIYMKYKEYRFDTNHKPQSMNIDVFTREEKELLDAIIRFVCCYSGKVLESFTHKETPWLATRADLPASTATDRIIEKEMMQAYFNKIKELYHMKQPKDIKAYTQMMFEQL